MKQSRALTLSGLLIVFSAFGCTSANQATAPTPQLDSYTELEMELRKLSDFVLTTEE